MPDENPEYLLASYALGGLSREEKERLFEAALKDQALFERLVEEDAIRLELEQPENRSLLLAALGGAAPQTWIERLVAWFRAPKHLLPAQHMAYGTSGKATTWFREPKHLLLSAGAAAALAVVVVVAFLPSNAGLSVALDPTHAPAISMLGIETPDTAAARQAELAQLFRLPLQHPIPAQLGLNKPGRTPEYRIGEDLRFGFSVQNGGNCLLLDRLADQAPVELFPNRFTSGMSTPAGQTVFIPPSGQGNLTVSGPPGVHQVRLIVVPADVTLDLSSPASWSPKATVIEQEYRVLPGER